MTELEVELQLSVLQAKVERLEKQVAEMIANASQSWLIEWGKGAPSSE